MVIRMISIVKPLGMTIQGTQRTITVTPDFPGNANPSGEEPERRLSQPIDAESHGSGMKIDTSERQCMIAVFTCTMVIRTSTTRQKRLDIIHHHPVKPT